MTSSEPDPSSQRTERDEWMLVPPSQDDLSSRFDPTQLRNRKFNTGRGAKAPAAKGGDNAIWTETPEQKRLRLENQVLGIKEPTAPSAEDGSRGEKGSAEEEARLRKIREFNVRLFSGDLRTFCSGRLWHVYCTANRVVDCRRKQEAQLSTTSTRRVPQRKKMTIRVRGRLIGRKILAEGRRSIMRRGRKC